MFFVALVLGLFVGGFYLIQEYKIPRIITDDYDCEKHPGVIGVSNPMPFESSRHYVNRRAKAFKNQVEEVCGV